MAWMTYFAAAREVAKN